MRQIFNSYRYSILQIFCLICLTKLSEYIEYSLINRSYITLFTRAVIFLILCSNLFNLNYSYRLSEKTVLYLVVLTMSIGVKCIVKTYSMLQNVPLYQNYLIKSLYLALKPFYFYYYTGMPAYYSFLNILHLGTVVFSTFLTGPSINTTLFALSYEFLDLFIIDELEDKFSVEMLLPELFAFVETLGELIAGVICVLLVEPCSFKYNLERKDICMYVVFFAVELLILAFSYFYRDIRFTNEKEAVLLTFDAHISNSIDSLFSVYISILDPLFCRRVYYNNSLYFLIHSTVLAELNVAIIHLCLYLMELGFTFFSLYR